MSAASTAPHHPVAPAERRWRFAPWQRLSQRLWVRLWLAVVAAVMVLTVLVGWAWRLAAEPPLREVVVRNLAGEVVGSGLSRPRPDPDAEAPGADGPPVRRAGPEFGVTMADGQQLTIHLPRPPRNFWTRPFGFFWMLGMVGLGVALATFPMVRHLTRRLERLQSGVERWGDGDLSARVPVKGNDEIAFLAGRFNHAAERVEGLVKSHKSLLANASHELRSPLARIRMGLELMDMAAPTLPAARGSLPPEGARFASGRPGGAADLPHASARAEIARNIAELDQLIDEILLASRLDARQADVGSFETVDLTGLAAEECARIGDTAQADFHAELDAPPVCVHGVARLLRRLVRNLLENARRYGDGRIHVALATRGDRAVLRVGDHGPGVPAGQRERIFEPFYRLPGASETEGGVGLGLALVKSIAERHGGRVRCEDRPGGGACFVVELPRAASGA